MFQAFCSITFESTETLTDMWCDYSTHNLECPGRRLASIFPCHRSDCKCSCGGVGDDWNVHLIQVFLKEMYVVAEAFVIGFFRPQRVWLICVAGIPFLFRNILADFWQAYFNATRTIASGVFCGIGDEQNAHLIQVFGSQLRLVFKLLQLYFPDYARLSDMSCRFSVIILTLPRSDFGKQNLLQQEGSLIYVVT